MRLNEYAETLQHQLAVAAAAGGPEAAALAERLIAPMDAAVRLMLQTALSDAADEISRELAPGGVELRIRARELAFAVIPPPAGTDGVDDRTLEHVPRMAPAGATGPEGATARINFRPPEELKARIEAAAESAGMSVNAFLVATLTSVLGAGGAGRPSYGSGPHHVQGWLS